MFSSLYLRVIWIVAAVLLALFLFFTTLIASFSAKTLHATYMSRGISALQEVQALLANPPSKEVRPGELEQQMAQFIDEWGASYIVYPILGQPGLYVTTHKFGTLILDKELLDFILKRGHHWTWRKSEKDLPNQEGEGVGVKLETIPDLGDFFDFSLDIPGQRGVVHIGFSKKILLSNVRSLLVMELSVVAAILVLGLLGFSFVVRRQFRPLERLMDYGRQLGRREFSAYCPVEDKGEAGRIAAVLQAISSDLRAAYDDLHEMTEEGKRFSVDAQDCFLSLHAILDLASEGLLITASNGTILLVNRAACRVFGQSEGLLIGAEIEELGHSGLSRAVFEAESNSGEVQEAEIELVGNRSGLIRAKNVVCQKGELADSSVTVVAIRGVRYHRGVDEEVAQVSEEMRRASQEAFEKIESCLNKVESCFQDVKEVLGEFRSLEEGGEHIENLRRCKRELESIQ